MMGVPVEYDDDVERRNTHPMLLPKIENERLTIPETELLNRNPALGAYMRPDFIAIYYTKIIHCFHNRLVQWSSTAFDEAILTNGPGFESEDSQLEFAVWHTLIVLFL